jgi:hypothetical protein
MLILRSEQIEACSAPVLDAFVERAVAHVELYFPDQHRALGEAEVRRAVRHGIARADRHRLETERDILRFVTLMFVFGRDFDEDPELPWAASILGSSDGATLRTSRLQTEALRHRDRGRGYRHG